MAHDTFFERPRVRMPTSLGELELPVAMRDGSALFAFFRIDPARAAEVLAGTAFAPARFARATALAALAAYDWRETSIGPYREVGLGIAVVPRGVAAPALPLLHLFDGPVHRDVAWHVLDLPVTTAFADASGREVYGFPKFVTGIDVDLAGEEVRTVVQAPAGEEPILVLDGRPGPGVPLGAMDLVFYTERAGEVLRTVIEGRGPMRTGFGHGLVLRSGGGDHAMAERVKALGMDGARPTAVQVCRRYEAVLGAPVPFYAVAKAA